MGQGVEKIAFLLLAIYHGMGEELQAARYLQVDETPVKVLDPEGKGKAATGYLWFYAHPQGDVFLEFCGGRGRAGLEQRWHDFTGTIQTDAYAVYESLRRARPAARQRLGCWAHVRRRWYKAAEEACREAFWFIGPIRQLYLIEAETRALSPHRAPRGAAAAGTGPVAGDEAPGLGVARPAALAAPKQPGPGGELLPQRRPRFGGRPSGRRVIFHIGGNFGCKI